MTANDVTKTAYGEDADVADATQAAGENTLTITEIINGVLLPLAAVNFAFDKAFAYFSDEFPGEIAARVSDIPTADLVEPKASIAGPALQGLAFTLDEPILKEMFLSLLATSMDRQKADQAHPAFVEVIRQLSSEGANLVQNILQSDAPIAIVELRLAERGVKGWQPLMENLLNLKDGTTGKAIESSRIPAMVDNWIRLGLVEVDYEKHLVGKDSYKWAENRPEVRKFRTEYKNYRENIEFGKGIIYRTSFGHQFAQVVGIE